MKNKKWLTIKIDKFKYREKYNINRDKYIYVYKR